MADAVRKLRASVYRDKANALRLLATETRFPEGRAGLLARAESFEKLAERVEAWTEAPTPAG